jgi:hypothetical protein
MAEETTAQFLYRRRKELTAQIAALRGQLIPKEAELAEITQIEASRTIAGGNQLTSGSFGFGSGLDVLASPNALAVASALSQFAAPTNALTGLTGNAAVDLGLVKQADHVPLVYRGMTIKEVVIQALLDHFPKGGTAADIRDFIRDAYGRVIEPSSLRPQMHRLKADDVLKHDPSTDTWDFANPRKRQLLAMYDHPTSRKAMRELQDDDVSEGMPRTKLGEI